MLYLLSVNLETKLMTNKRTKQMTERRMCTATVRVSPVHASVSGLLIRRQLAQQSLQTSGVMSLLLLHAAVCCNGAPGDACFCDEGLEFYLFYSALRFFCLHRWREKDSRFVEHVCRFVYAAAGQ